MVKFRYEKEAGKYVIELDEAQASLLFRWMQLAAVCLQTWPTAAHELLLQAREHKLI